MPPYQTFIAHTHRDNELAKALAEFVHDSFGGEVGVKYSSSDDVDRGITSGTDWLRWVHKNLVDCRTIFVVLSPDSLHKPWPLWEAGVLQGLALVGSAVRIVPTLYGVDPSDVPGPLRSFQPVRVAHTGDVQVLQATMARDLVAAGGSPGDPVVLAGAVARFREQVGHHLTASRSAFAGRALHEFENLRALGGVGEFARKHLLDQLTRLARGVYTIHTPVEIYRHDAEAIEKLVTGDRYRATHWFQANPGATQETKSGAAFESYMRAQYRAADRGVRVQRVYVVRDLHRLGALEEDQRTHLRQVSGSKIDCRLIGQDKLEKGYSDDFVLIGNECVGIGIPVRGPIASSEYHVHANPARPSEEFTRYDGYFGELYESAKALPQTPARIPLPKLAQAPSPAGVPDRAEELAFVTHSRVNIMGKPAERLMIVLRTNGCAWDKGDRGCTMCDFKRHAITGAAVRPEWLLAQFEAALRGNPLGSATEQLDILTLGSFLNVEEVPVRFTTQVMSRIAAIPQIRRVVIESRPRYVNPDRLNVLRALLGPEKVLELGVGVETSNDRLRSRVIRKGMTWAQIAKAVEACKRGGVHFQAYLLVGTPTLSPSEVVRDAVRSARDVAELCERHAVPFRIAFEPVFITKGTTLGKDFAEKRYDLINLWQVVLVLRETHRLGPIFVGMSDEGLAGNDVPQGCPNCTAGLRDRIEAFNGTQDIGVFDDLVCDCYPPAR